MDNGLHGLHGAHAIPPVVQELRIEPGCVITHHHNMVGRTASVVTMRLKTVMRDPVLVSLLASKVL